MPEFKSGQSRIEAKSSAISNKDANNSSFTLQVVSPSVGVPKTLDFHDLPFTLQVKELKKIIRDSLYCRPPDELQRLIHHGRMLTRETETMSEIFGEEVLRNSDVQIIHLVLRPTPENSNNSGGNDTKEINKPTQAIMTHHSPTHQNTERSASSLSCTNQSQGLQAQQILPGTQYLQQQTVLLQLEELQSLMGQRLLLLQRETQRLNQELQNMGTQTLLRQNSTESYQNQQLEPFQSTSLTQGSTLLDQAQISSFVKNQSNLSSEVKISKGTRDLARENDTQGVTKSRSEREILSDEQSNQLINDPKCTNTNLGRYQVSVNETHETASNQSSKAQQHSLGQFKDSNDILSILRNSDRFNVINQHFDQCGSTNTNPESSRPRILSPASSRSPTVSPIPLSSNSRSISEISATDCTPTNTLIASRPLVYILSSPSGPRAILMSNTQNYFTPPRNPGRNRFTFTSGGQISVNSSILLDRVRPNRRQAREIRNPNENAAEPRVAEPQANLRFGGIGIQVGQILWLIIRLAGFVWFFTAGNPSWSRWFMASGLAFIVFIVLTGILNGAVEQLWSPIRRHLEALVPLGPVDHQNIPLQQNGIPEPVRDDDRGLARPLPGARNQNLVERRTDELDHTEVTGTSIEQRVQSNSGLLMTRIRRLEQSLILFVASLVPGVSERHIAHREAQANREIERRQQLMEATAEQVTRASSESTLQGANQERENIETNGHNQTDNPLDQEDLPQAEPLVQL